MIQRLGFVAGAACGIVLVATCSTQKYVGLPDGGADLAADGAALVDAMLDGLAVQDAKAQQSNTYSGSCDQEQKRIEHLNNGDGDYTTIDYYAIVTVAGFDPTNAPHVTATRCGFTYHGSTTHQLNNTLIRCPRRLSRARCTAPHPS